MRVKSTAPFSDRFGENFAARIFGWDAVKANPDGAIYWEREGGNTVLWMLFRTIEEARAYRDLLPATPVYRADRDPKWGSHPPIIKKVS